MKFSQQKKGFTLIELLVTIVIMAILAALAYPSLMTYIRRARLDNARAMMSDTAHALERHYAQNHSFCQAGTNCTPPDIQFVTKDNLSSAPATGVVVTLDNDNYNFSIVKANPNNYILKGAPKADLYSSDVLSANQLVLFYDSSVPAFIRCTSGGADLYETSSRASDPTALPDADGCEVMQ